MLASAIRRHSKRWWSSCCIENPKRIRKLVYCLAVIFISFGSDPLRLPQTRGLLFPWIHSSLGRSLLPALDHVFSSSPLRLPLPSHQRRRDSSTSIVQFTCLKTINCYRITVRQTSISLASHTLAEYGNLRPIGRGPNASHT